MEGRKTKTAKNSTERKNHKGENTTRRKKHKGENSTAAQDRNGKDETSTQRKDHKGKNSTPRKTGKIEVAESQRRTVFKEIFSHYSVTHGFRLVSDTLILLLSLIDFMLREVGLLHRLLLNKGLGSQLRCLFCVSLR